MNGYLEAVDKVCSNCKLGNDKVCQSCPVRKSMEDYYEIETHYCEKDDMTFITRQHYVNGKIDTQECYGFYYGEPKEHETMMFQGQLVAKATL